MQEENNLIVFHNVFHCNAFVSSISPCQEMARLTVVLQGLLFQPQELSDSSLVTEQRVSLCLPQKLQITLGTSTQLWICDATAVLGKHREESGG